jgi:uncharacterized protein YecE (DUF72 family)
MRYKFEDWHPIPRPPEISQHGFFVGTSGYYFDDWIGLFNPPKPPRGTALSEKQKEDQDRLKFYHTYFPFLEINTTFYQEPTKKWFADIDSRSRQGTRLAVKAHRDISHTRTWNSKNGRCLMQRHVDAVHPILKSGRFYSFLIQLEDRERLGYLIEVSNAAISNGCDVHIEFRHRSWHRMESLQSLKDSTIGICNTEIPVSHAFPLKPYATSNKGYVRYSGRNYANWNQTRPQRTHKDRIAARNARYDYLYSLQEIGQRTESQGVLRQKTSVVAVAYNNHYNAQAVHNAIQNIKRISEPGFMDSVNLLSHD